MKDRIIGIDLGTTNTLIWIKGNDMVSFNEPTVLAWDKETHEVIEIGYLAHKLLGKVPENIEVMTPMQYGNVADIEACVRYLDRAFSNINETKRLRGSKTVFITPAKMSKVSKTALYIVAKELGIREVHFIEAPRAAAAGSGIDLFSTKGCLVVDIGGAKTDIAAMTLGRIINERTIFYGGNAIDERIERFVRRKYQLSIGPKTSEYIKMKLGTLDENADNSLLEISGKSVVNGLPHTAIISTNEITKIIQDVFDEIADAVIDTLDSSSPEVAADIVHSGIIICGGGSLLSGVRDYFEKKLSTPIHVSAYPLEASIEGVKQYYSDFLKEDPYVEKNRFRF